MKRIVCLVVAISMFFVMAGCGKTKTLHCDHCGTEVVVEEKSNMTEEWLIYCEECNEELFADDPVLGAK